LFLTPSSARELRERRRRGRRGRRGRRDRKTARSSFVRSLSLSLSKKKQLSDSKKKMKKREEEKKAKKTKSPKLLNWPKTEKGGLLSLWVLPHFNTYARVVVVVKEKKNLLNNVTTETMETLTLRGVLEG